MTEGFRAPQPVSDDPALPGGAARGRQDVVDTVHRIMGQDITPPDDPAAGAGEPLGRPGSPGNGASTTDAVKEQVGGVADTAKRAGGQVAGTVQEQAGEVTAEAGRQAKKLLSEAQSELNGQAAATQQRAADGLRALEEELTGLATHSAQDGIATDLARQAADKAQQAATWLADRDPGTLLQEVRSFARRKPGAYLAIALGAGVLAGRLARGLTAPTNDTAAATPSRQPEPLTPTATGALTPAAPVPSEGERRSITDPVTGVTVYPAGPPTAGGELTP